jgi:hypothetical protein
MIKSEVRSLLILKPVIAPSLIRDCPLTIQGNDYYDYTTGEVKSNANAAPIEFGIDISHLCVISP